MTLHSKILITGLGRSGTSAIASIVKGLDYYLGHGAVSSNGEDKDLRALLSEGKIDELRDALMSRSKFHPLVAFKDPKLFSQEGEKLEAAMDADWAYIIVFRDPLATAIRNNASVGDDRDEALVSAATRQLKLVRFYETIKSRRPVHLVSFEKLLKDRDRIVQELCQFIGMPADEATIEKVKLVMDEGRARYLNTSGHV